MNIIFGPINSRRFGKSLGIDLSPNKKQCNFDCLYCELDSATTVSKYTEIVSVKEVMEALTLALKEHQDIDVLTVTANGEPTLYPYLSELMDRINSIKGEIKTLILSNSAKISEPKTQKALMKFDTVKLSLDCATAHCLKRVDRSHKSISIKSIKEGIVKFKEKFSNPLIIEILMVKGINNKPNEIKALNEYLLELKPTRIDLGTVDRPPAYRVEPLSYEELQKVALTFDSSLAINITSRKKLTAKPSSYSKYEILQTIKKRPLTEDDVTALFDKQSIKRLKDLINKKQIILLNSSRDDFFVINE
jgi:wyosine [tRNA(Phe)-imidazoG37] synthetase (radical SAM superfamily)